MTKVIVSTSASHDYDFFAPITCRMWKEVVGYSPEFIFATDGKRLSDRSMLVFGECLSICGHGHAMANDMLQGVAEAQVAQVVRLIACQMDCVSPDDILMTGDVDMWPLQKTFFEIMDPEKINLYGANVYRGDRAPMCYVAAKVSKWREMFGLKDDNGWTAAFDRVRWNGWDTDEDELEKAIIRMGGKAACAMKARPGSRHGLMSGRVDRAKWVYEGKENGLIDAHLPRPGYGRETWETMLLPVLKDFCPQIVDWACQYRERYLSVFDK